MPKTFFERSIMSDALCQVHVVAVAVGPVAARARASRALLERKREDRKADPASLDYPVADLSRVLARYQNIQKSFDRDDGRAEEGSPIGYRRVRGLQSNDATAALPMHMAGKALLDLAGLAF